MAVSSLSLLILKPVNAQSTTKPSAPEFTVQAPNESTIELVIKNQAFTNSDSVNAIVYDYRVKDHNSEQWISQGGIGQLQSDSKTTLITIKTPYLSDYPFDPALKMFVNSSLIDFQVQAKTGYYVVVPIQGGSDIEFHASETSEWSNTQTVTLPINSNSASPTPTVPEFPLANLGITFLVITSLLGAAATCRLFLKRNRKLNLSTLQFIA